MFKARLHAHQRYRGAARLGEHEMRSDGSIFGAQHGVSVDRTALFFG